MSNDLTGNPWIIDTVGLIADHPVSIRKIIFYPNAAGNGALIYSYNPSSVLSEEWPVTATAASGVITSTGAFTSAKATAYGVFEVAFGSLTAAGAASANIGVKRMIASVDNDNQITLSPTTGVTDEASGVYHIKTYTGTRRIVIESAGTEKLTEYYDPPQTDGFHMPNLIVATMDASCIMHIYI